MAIQSELNVPVKYIGVGEHIDDLQKFDADAFVTLCFCLTTCREAYMSMAENGST